MLNLPRTRVFWAVALGHLTNDVFMSMGPVLLAFFSVTILPMSNTQIGLTVSAAQLLGAVTQPGFGLLGDRNGGRLLGAGGVAWTVSFAMLALVGAQTGYYGLMFLPFVTMAIGSGAFHPIGAMHAATSDKTRVASSVAYFFLMGQLGLAMGPFLAGSLLDAANPHIHRPLMDVFSGTVAIPTTATLTPIFVMGMMAIPVAIWMAFSIPASKSYRAGRDASAGQSLRTLELPVRPLIILGAMVALRSLAQPGSVTFIPVLFQNKGWSPAEYGAITSSFWIASGISGVMFGNLADRIDRRLVVAGSLILAAPAFFMLPLLDGTLAFSMAIIAGGLSGGSHSIIVVLAQDLIPGAKGFASGAILGFVFGTGALGSLLIGTFSDLIGLGTTFQLVSVAIVFASILALALPVHQPPRITTIGDEPAVNPAISGD